MSSEGSGRAKKRRLKDRNLSPTSAAIQRAKNADRVSKYLALKKLRSEERYQEASTEQQKQMEAEVVKKLMQRRKAEGLSAEQKLPKEIHNEMADFIPDNEGDELDDASEKEEDNRDGGIQELKLEEEEEEKCEDEYDAVKEGKNVNKNKFLDRKDVQEALRGAMEGSRYARSILSDEGLRNMLKAPYEQAAVKFEATGSKSDKRIMEQRRKELEEFDRNPFWASDLSVAWRAGRETLSASKSQRIWPWIIVGSVSVISDKGSRNGIISDISKFRPHSAHQPPKSILRAIVGSWSAPNSSFRLAPALALRMSSNIFLWSFSTPATTFLNVMASA
jgi:hypothetical protein